MGLQRIMQFQEGQRQQMGKGITSQKRLGLRAAMRIATPRKKDHRCLLAFRGGAK